ncbi:MAG: hypothetical protein K9K66_15665 [Desulfarculaceae bacterium]|nr:hypothetical protein [Desulfarculaceae bacterium]MCF8073570.1 hypothetical protein [Desulfarculaceae bacterium]MCF8103092.1 hypothetical protein [Desulfarculaceae bacterium]MCF8115714.1 hypothetical protein [Desulfarculaceae bacterium]
MTHKEWEKSQCFGKTIAQTLMIIAPFVVIYFIVYFLGVGDWVRNNASWIIFFILCVQFIFMNNLCEWVVNIAKDSAINDKEEILEKLCELELEVDRLRLKVSKGELETG